MQETKITLRMPAELHAKLTEFARGDSPPSSLNSEIVRRLYRSLEIDSETGVLTEAVAELIAELKKTRAGEAVKAEPQARKARLGGAKKK
jgi:hypothetical protein